MTRRMVWTAVVLLVLLALAALWVLPRLEQVDIERREPPDVEALRNPYLAAMRFLETMGRTVVLKTNAHALENIPPGGVILLDAGRRSEMSDTRVQRLLEWVAGGGYLVVATEQPDMDDPLLALLGIAVDAEAEDDEESDAEGDEEPVAAGAPDDEDEAGDALPDSIAVGLPGSERPLQITTSLPGFDPGESEPEWLAGRDETTPQILHLRHGVGHVTVVGSLSALFANSTIGHFDHAELLWRLIGRYAPKDGGPIWLMTRITHESLWQWLVRALPHALFSAAVLLLLWLWSVVPRFGAVAPTPSPARRELREHLQAVGRYVWHAGGGGQWLAVARAAFHEQLGRSHPALAALPRTEQVQALAELTQHPGTLIDAALHQAADSPQSFTLALRMLRKLERTLRP